MDVRIVLSNSHGLQDPEQPRGCDFCGRLFCTTKTTTVTDSEFNSIETIRQHYLVVVAAVL